MLNKKIVLTAILSSALVTTAASAASNGAYVGGALGYGYTHQFKDLSVHGGSDHGMAERVDAGYQFNKNFAAELGYTHFADATFKSASNLKVKAYDVDIVGKGILPLDNGFSVFGTLGVAYLKEEASANGFSSVSHSNYYPTFGAGVSYDITSNLSTELAYSRIQKTSDSRKELDSTDFFGLGLSYHFG